MPVTATDVAVVGGGIVGTAAAAFLAEAGLSVRLYERTEIGAGASGRNSGIVQHPFDPVLAGLYTTSLEHYRRLAGESAGAFRLSDEPSGLLYIGRDPATVARLAAAWSSAWPATRPSVLDGAALAGLEPALAPDLVACRLEIGFPVAPAAATTAFATLAVQHGVEVHLSEAIVAQAGGRTTGVTVNGRLEPAGAVLVAAGPWTPRLVDPGGRWRPIHPAWGVVVTVAIGRAPRHTLEEAEIDIEPREPATGDPAGPPNGAMADPPRPTAADVAFSLVPAGESSALGSTFLDREPDPAAWLDPIRERGARFVPGIAGAAVGGVRLCARPISGDGRPLVGSVPGIEGLVVAAGNGPWGISTGPATARLAADLILGRVAPAAIPAPLAASRFGSLGLEPSLRSR